MLLFNEHLDETFFILSDHKQQPLTLVSINGRQARLLDKQGRSYVVGRGKLIPYKLRGNYESYLKK